MRFLNSFIEQIYISELYLLFIHLHYFSMKSLVVCSVVVLLILLTVPSSHGYASAGAILKPGKREFMQVSVQILIK